MRNVSQGLRLGIMKRLGKELNTFTYHSEAILTLVELDQHIMPLYRLLQRVRLNE